MKRSGNVNRIWIKGKIVSEPISESDDVVSFLVEVIRKSNKVDTLEVHTYKKYYVEDMDYIDFEGFIICRWFKGKLRVYTFASKVNFVDEVEHDNEVLLRGTLCVKPKFRVTPMGKHITELVIAVNHGKYSDYIPTIVWYGCARECQSWCIGDNVEVKGHFQSRDYVKHGKTHRVYELCGYYIERIGEDGYMVKRKLEKYIDSMKAQFRNVETPVSYYEDVIDEMKKLIEDSRGGVSYLSQVDNALFCDKCKQLSAWQIEGNGISILDDAAYIGSLYTVVRKQEILRDEYELGFTLKANKVSKNYNFTCNLNNAYIISVDITKDNILLRVDELQSGNNLENQVFPLNDGEFEKFQDMVFHEILLVKRKNGVSVNFCPYDFYK
jgi:single-stranded DNA-binding protein